MLWVIINTVIIHANCSSICVSGWWLMYDLEVGLRTTEGQTPRCLWIFIDLIKCNILFQVCIMDSSPVQHRFCPQSQVMCGETCWTRTLILSQNDGPFGRWQAAAEVPRVLVTFGKHAHKQTVSHGSFLAAAPRGWTLTTALRAGREARQRDKSLECASNRWDQHQGDRSSK